MKKDETTSETLPSSYKILSLIEKGIQTAPKLITISDLSRATIYRYLISLKERHLIAKLGKSPALYSATARGRIELMRAIKHTKSRTHSHKVSLPSLRIDKKNTRVHALAVKYPLLENKFKGDWDKVVSGFKNSVKTYTFLPEAKVTISKTSKSIILHIHDKTINKSDLFSGYLEWLRLVEKVAYFYLLERGIKFDIFSPKIIKQHIATEAGQFKEKVEISPYTVGLGRKAKSYYPSSMDAKAWLDHSKGVLETESNDLPYEEKLLLLPEMAFETNINVSNFKDNLALYNQSLEVYNKNIKLHMGVMTEMKNTLKVMSKKMEGEK